MFYIKEAWRNLRYAGITTVITFFSLLLASVFALSSYLVTNFSDALNAELTKNVTASFYLDDSISIEAKEALIAKLRGETGVKGVKYISAAEAEKEFISTTGEDFRKILGNNPLPASILVSLDTDGKKMSELDRSVEEMAKHKGVASYEFRSIMLQEIIEFTGKVRSIAIVVTVLFLLLSLYLAYTSIRSAFEARREDLNTMRLVGGSLFKIKFPAYLGSFALGLMCAFITLFFYSIVVNSRFEFLGVRAVDTAGPTGTILALGAAPLIAIIGTFLASFSLKIELRNH